MNLNKQTRANWRKVRNYIATHPDEYDQGLCHQCIIGIARRLFAGTPEYGTYIPALALEYNEFLIVYEAAAREGATPYYWPKHYKRAYEKATTNAERAAVAIRYINRILKAGKVD